MFRPAFPFNNLAIRAEDTNPPTPPPITVIDVEVATLQKMEKKMNPQQFRII